MNRFKTKISLPPRFNLIFFSTLAVIFLFACNDGKSIDLTHKEVVQSPAEINTKAEDIIEGTLEKILKNDPVLPDSFRFRNANLMDQIYKQKNYLPIWSSNGRFSGSADSLFSLIDSSRLYGLIPYHYYQQQLADVRKQLVMDTAREKKLDASLWAYSDLMLTHSFIQILKDVKLGRLLPDSIMSKDSIVNPGFIVQQMELFQRVHADSFVRTMEPVHVDYWKIRQALPRFLGAADFRPYTYVASKDSATLRKLLYRRISEEDTAVIYSEQPDSLMLVKAIRQYQKSKKIKEDGKFSTSLVNRLNNTDEEKFIRIAINLDRFKQLQKLPEQYIWVNIPGYYLELRNQDTVTISSKVCVGKPNTRTPIITSAISDMVTYPKWTIPESIVKKEILPGLKRDPEYTRKKGYSLIDKDGNEVDPLSVNWSKYKEYIPYKVVQGSGDDNALGILKFNFPNKHQVYLHDTNQRYLFSRTSRALSHGCVRVQSWYDLSKFILTNDSLYSARATPIDSLDSWLATKQKRTIPVRKPIPLFIRYFTCNVNEGKVVFYDDVYAEDVRYRDKFLNPQSFL